MKDKEARGSRALGARLAPTLVVSLEKREREREERESEGREREGRERERGKRETARGEREKRECL